jgi:hypothetical protein
MISEGAPAAIAAFKIICAALIVHSLALGCGEKIMALRVFRAIKALKIVVAVGFVTGTIPATIPTGSAIF